MGRVSVIGFPDSAGSYAAGQDQAPEALRKAGLVEALVAAGLEVDDDGDLPEQVWAPDRSNPYAQNVDKVVANLQALAARLEPLIKSGDVALVLGGNCTVALPIMAVLLRLEQDAPGLLYIDAHFDINTPETTPDGSLDWMGLAHALALPGSVSSLAGAFGQTPLLDPAQVAWLGVDDAFATDWERDQAKRLGLHVDSAQSMEADPVGSVKKALDFLPAGPLSVHVDVDVPDFIDAPLSENTDRRNRGPTLSQLGEALATAAQDSRFHVLSIGELNPTRSAGEPSAIQRFIEVIAAALA